MVLAAFYSLSSYKLESLTQPTNPVPKRRLPVLTFKNYDLRWATKTTKVARAVRSTDIHPCIHSAIQSWLKSGRMVSPSLHTIQYKSSCIQVTQRPVGLYLMPLNSHFERIHWATPSSFPTLLLVCPWWAEFVGSPKLCRCAARTLLGILQLVFQLRMIFMLNLSLVLQIEPHHNTFASQALSGMLRQSESYSLPLISAKSQRELYCRLGHHFY